MIEISNTEVFGIEGAMRGMRNPMNSWSKGDTHGNEIGDNDIDLAVRLAQAGTDHRKFMRMIIVQADIKAPLYWWKEYDTYKVGTVANSCSTMHKIHAKEFTLDDFSHEHLYTDTLSPYCPMEMLKEQIKGLNFWRQRYLETKRKGDWWQLIQMLPSSYNQLRTVTLNYEVIANMCRARMNHKLDEWRAFCSWACGLPYAELFAGSM